MTIGILVPSLGDSPEPPEARPLGRAALAVAQEGIDVIFGFAARDGRLIGARARPGRWEAAEGSVCAVYDRFPSQGHAAAHGAILRALPDVPLANAPEIVRLCRDKLACQRFLAAAGVGMPEVEPDPQRFGERLAAWGAAFHKPRHGAFGRGVTRVVLGEPIPDRVDGTVADDAPILQRAIPPPSGFAGQCARVLVQRETDGRWAAHAPVLRQSRADPVVNAARGAEVVDVDAGRPDLAAALRSIALAVAEAFRDPLAVELGVDLVLGEDGQVWPIEVNGTPRGRLEVLAMRDPVRWGASHLAACARPIRYLARRFDG